MDREYSVIHDNIRTPIRMACSSTTAPAAGPVTWWAWLEGDLVVSRNVPKVVKMKKERKLEMERIGETVAC